MLDVYKKRIMSRFADVKWDHVQYVGRNAADTCVLVMVSNLPKHLRDLEEVIVDLQMVYQKKENREKNKKSVVEKNHQYRQIQVLEHQSILMTTQTSQNYQRVLQL